MGFVIVLICAVIGWIGANPLTASAHGKNPDLIAYCEAKHGKGYNPMSVRYDAKNQHWRCIRAAYYGINFVQGAVNAPLNVSDACARQAQSRLVHFHEGSNVADPRNVHCGIVEGTIGKESQSSRRQQQPEPLSVLQLCNRSSKSVLNAAISFWDTRRPNDKGWTSKGWYTLNWDQCVDVPLDRVYRGEVYVYANSADGTTWAPSDGDSFCIDESHKFEYRNADRNLCLAINNKRVVMYRYTIGPGVNPYNFSQ